MPIRKDSLTSKDPGVRYGQGLSKFCDFNITNIIDMDVEKFTFEIRIIPPTMAAGESVSAAAYFADIPHQLAA